MQKDNRRRSTFDSPKTFQVCEARSKLNLTQDEASKIIMSTPSAWQQWEYGTRKMHPGLWELFCLKTRIQNLDNQF